MKKIFIVLVTCLCTHLLVRLGVSVWTKDTESVIPDRNSVFRENSSGKRIAAVVDDPKPGDDPNSIEGLEGELSFYKLGRDDWAQVMLSIEALKGGDRIIALKQALLGRMEVDFDGALLWIELNNIVSPGLLFNEIISEFSKNDRSMELLSALWLSDLDKKSKKMMIENMASTLDRASRPAYFEWLTEHSKDFLSSVSYSNLTRSWANEDLNEAIGFSLNLNAEERTHALNGVVRSLSENMDYRAMSDYPFMVPIEYVDERVLKKLSNPNFDRKILESGGKGVSQVDLDYAYRNLAANEALKNPLEAIDKASRIKDVSMRDDAYTFIVKRFAEGSRESAEGVLSELNDISPKVRTSLEHFLKREPE